MEVCFCLSPGLKQTKQIVKMIGVFEQATAPLWVTCNLNFDFIISGRIGSVRDVVFGRFCLLNFLSLSVSTD